jgi:hypothetical protein
VNRMGQNRIETLRRWAEQEMISTEQVLSVFDEAIRARVAEAQLRADNDRLRVALLEAECREPAS